MHKFIADYKKVDNFSGDGATLHFENSFNHEIPLIFIDPRVGRPNLIVSDPNIIQELFLSKNKFTDKDPMVSQLFSMLMKESTVFSPSNELWATKRKKISSAFYKDKLIKMFEVVKKTTLNKVEKWKMEIADKEKEIDFIYELEQHLSQCIQGSLFGSENLDVKLDY